MCKSVCIWSYSAPYIRNLVPRAIFKNSLFFDFLSIAKRCPGDEVDIFLNSDLMRRDTKHLSIISSNAEKCGPE